jgi:hypothetical protein
VIRVQNFASGVIGELIRRQPPSTPRTAFAWQLAVGPKLARATTIELNSGTLIVRARDPRWGTEIERARGTILARMQHLLGVGELREIVVRNP